MLLYRLSQFLKLKLSAVRIFLTNFPRCHEQTQIQRAFSFFQAGLSLPQASGGHYCLRLTAR